MATTVDEAGDTPSNEEELNQVSSAASTQANIPPSPGSKSKNDVNSAQQTNTKIDVLLKPTGDAPIMTKKRWAVDRTKTISWVIEFVRRYLKFDQQDSLFLYVNQSFAPTPDLSLGVLFDCFGSDGKLVLHYCRTQAWG